jgi:hypothetical protein
MIQILDKIISICDDKIRDTMYAIQCNIMHERQGRGIDYSIYSEILGNAHIVKDEISWFKKSIIDIVENLELSVAGEWENPYISNDFNGIFDDEDKKKDVYDYLLGRHFNDNELVIMTSPSKFVNPFIEQNFAIKNLMRVGLKKFFPNLQLKKIVKMPNGENIIRDYNEKDENSDITNNDIEKIESVSDFDAFVDNAKNLQTMLLQKANETDILIFIRDN